MIWAWPTQFSKNSSCTPAHHLRQRLISTDIRGTKPIAKSTWSGMPVLAIVVQPVQTQQAILEGLHWS